MAGDRLGRILAALSAGGDTWSSAQLCAVCPGIVGVNGAGVMLSVTQAPISEADVMVARAFADLATLSIVQQRASAEAQRVNEQLSAALTSRVAIEQAKGVVAERAGVDLAEAFSRLRTYARDRNLRLTDVAQAAVAGTLDLDSLAWARAARW